MSKIEYNREEIRDRYRDLFEFSLDYIYINDLRGNFLDANDITLKAFGYEKNEINKLNFINLLADKKELIKAIEVTKNIVNTGRQSERSEYRLKTKSGEIIYIETYGIPLKKEGKIYAIFGIGTNITERKLAENRLRESELRYRNLFESSPFGAAIVNSTGKIIDCNPTVLDLTGYAKEELINQNFIDLNFFQDKDLSLLLKLIKKIFNGEKVHRQEIQLRRKDGSYIWIQIQASIVEFEQKPLLQVIIYDISRRKEADFLVNEQLQKLKELDNIRKNLIVRISHELKTPLMILKGGLEYLIDYKQTQLDKETIEIVSSLDRATRRLNILITDLIDSIKIEYDRLELSLLDIDIVNLILESYNELNYLFNQRHLNVILDLPDKLILKIDSIRIKQVLNNLIINAVKNTPPGGEIEINLLSNKKNVKICVIDDGIGITDDEMNKLFTRFGKIERFGEAFENIDPRGSGLGLYICKAIIKLHRGKIWAKSEGRNHGATFCVELPFK